MPFTPSHAVIALPFLRTPLVPAAIAVGAMTPDLPLFVRGMGLRYSMTHDLRWLVITAAVALVLLLVWRCILRPGVRELSPRWLSARLPKAWDGGAREGFRETFPVTGPAGRGRASVRGILLLAASLVIGIVSHVVWDVFTHEGRAGVSALPILAEPWGPLAGYKWLQHGSSFLGLAILGVWAALWLSRRTPERDVPRMLNGRVRVGWWVSLPVVLAAALSIGLGMYGPLRPGFGIAHLAYAVLPPACALWGAGTVALCVLVQVARRRAMSASSSENSP